MTTTAREADAVAVARDLRPQIEAFTEEGERIRRLPDGAVRLLRDHGFFGMMRSVDRGGRGVDRLSTLHAIEEISVADASVGWCAAIGSGSIGEPAISDEVAREIFKPNTPVCGVGAPTGRAIPVDGGFRLSGRWSYASGCHHSEWIFLGSVVFEGDKPRMSGSGAPELRIALVPMREIEIVPDSWLVSGLRGTGSNDVVANDVFVPEERTAAIALGAPPAAGAEYRIPMFTLFGLALVPVAFGAARRAIDELVDMASGKTPMMSGSKLRDKPVTQYEIARAEGKLQAARAFLYATVGELMDRAERQEEIDMTLRARVKLACAHGTEAAAQAVEIAYGLGGATSNFEQSPLQRCQRDVHAVTQHFVISAANYEPVGRVMMGLDPGTPII